MACWNKLGVASSHWLNCFHGYLKLGGNLKLAVAMSLKRQNNIEYNWHVTFQNYMGTYGLFIR